MSQLSLNASMGFVGRGGISGGRVLEGGLGGGLRGGGQHRRLFLLSSSSSFLCVLFLRSST